MMRISMSLPKKLLNEFDDVLKDRGYNSRSNGIRDALKDYIIRYQWMKEIEGDRMGVVSVIYDPHYTDVLGNIMDIQHSFLEEINATMHIHMSDKNCLEVIVVKGDANQIRDLTEQLMRLNGVEHVKLTTTVSTEKKTNRLLNNYSLRTIKLFKKSHLLASGGPGVSPNYFLCKALNYSN